MKVRWINKSSPNGKRPLDRPKWRWIDEIERNLIEIELRDVETRTWRKNIWKQASYHDNEPQWLLEDQRRRPRRSALNNELC